MRNTPPKIDKYDPHKKWHTLQKNTQVCFPRTELSDFKREFLNLLCDSDSW